MMTLMRPALVSFFLLAVITGVVYPRAVHAAAQGIFPQKADGSLIQENGKTVGSSLVGQPFTDPKYFWGRVSATGPAPYNGAASTGSNLGPTNPALIKAVKDRIAALKEADPDNTSAIPVDLVTSSGSGLDPHISPAAAEYQVRRVAKARGLDEASVRRIVAEHTEGRLVGVLGEPRVNVLPLNLALDRAR